MQGFSVNSPFLYLLAIIVVAFVVAQSIFFLIRAWKRALAIGMDKAKLYRIVRASAVFTIAPAVAILLGVITLSKFLGLPLPWLRLSVVGALTYELPAASAAASAMSSDISKTVTDPRVYSTIAWVMTLGIIPGLFYMPFTMKKIQGGVMKIGQKDKRWSEIFMSALFLGMLSAFLGMIFANVRTGLVGWIPVFTMFISAAIMLVLGGIYKKFKLNWLQDYALPLSMLGAMALAIPITNWIV